MIDRLLRRTAPACALAVTLAGLGVACAARQSDRAARPRLVVLVAVDQLRGDLLPVYRPAFTGGLRRLLDEGRWFPEARIAHVPSNSMPGHVTLATGMHPRHHGIVDNGFFELPDGEGPARYVSALQDSTVRVPGADDESGVSPRRLRTGGIADWIVAEDGRARVVAISMNEYGALLHAGRGHERRAVYWFAPGAGRFVTTTYYDTATPPWIAAVNAALSRAIPAETLWTPIVPPTARGLALPDDGPWENGGLHTRFPHRWPAERDPDWKPTHPRWLYFTPFPDSVTLALARAVIETTTLGRGAAVDYLSITLGSSDGIGHWYGPRSLEALDNLVRLDRELGALLRTLDRVVGRHGYVLALSADHGVADIPEAPRAPGAIDFGAREGRRVSPAQLDSLFARLAREAPRTLAPDSARSIAERVLRAQPFVASVMRRSELADSTAPPVDSFVTLYRNGWHPRRIPVRPLASAMGTLARFGLEARLEPGTVVGDVPAEHGSPYDYDRRVALIFFGAGVASGRDDRAARTVDVAPTLAALARVRPPATDGRSLLGAPTER